MTVSSPRDHSPIASLAAIWRDAYRLPPDYRVSDFCDAELIVPTGPLAGTRWRTDFAPYQRGILDSFHEPGVELVAVMGSSQWGKTSIALNLVAYHVAHDPCPILVVQPTRDPMAKDFSLNRLDPLIAATPMLAERVSKRRATNQSNTTYLKTYRGGLLAIAGANSASSLASRSIRLLILDESRSVSARVARRGKHDRSGAQAYGRIRQPSPGASDLIADNGWGYDRGVV